MYNHGYGFRLHKKLKMSTFANNTPRNSIEVIPPP